MEMDNSAQAQQPSSVTPNEAQSLPVNTPICNQKGFVPIIIGVIILVIVVGTGAYYLGTKKNNTPQNGENPVPSPATTVTTDKKENIAACAGVSNFSEQFYIVFKGGISRQDAEKILRDNNVKSFNLTSLPPDSYKFKLADNRVCESLKLLYDDKDTYSIPAVYWEPNEGTQSKTFSITCPDVPSSFIVQNGTVQPSNTFIITFYKNKDKVEGVLKSLGATILSGGVQSETEKEKTYYVTFNEGQVCQSFERLKSNKNVKSAGNVPWMPTVR